MKDWPFAPPITPMEAEVADQLPPSPGWSYEPKWDGFRVLMWSPAGRTAPLPLRAERERGTEATNEAAARPALQGPRLDSRNGKPLLRYFPELAPALAQIPPGTVVDGEVVVVIAGRLDFDALQNRVHPAESRVRRLAEETPASLVLFDLLAYEGRDLRPLAFRERRRHLEELAERLGDSTGGTLHPDFPWLMSPATTDRDLALRWFDEFEPAGFDGVVAKALERPYAEGRREMIKLKHRRTVDCVVGGYRLHKDGRSVGSILLGLYDPRGELHFIGHCSSFSQRAAEELLVSLRALEGTDSGFGEHARRPGETSRWSNGKELAYVAVPPLLVVEVSYDQLTGDRFRHATRFERWRPDKKPGDCTLDQLERPRGAAFAQALAAGLAGRPVRHPQARHGEKNG